ncbi:MAG: ABC transporter ATP-binding protein [Treponema sp.]|nr:ABC transporter ATP-binding protein [Treponema sp.]
MNLLEIKNLSKKYPAFTLKDVSFSLEEGYIMGFIGRNGAGKTTTLKAMLNLIHPESGDVKINGFDIKTNETEIKQSIGFVTGLDGFYTTKKIKTVTNVTKRFFKNWDEALYRELMEKFALDENKKIKELSAGMKVKYQIALAMCHGAQLLILDEPTSGLDPVSRDELVILFQDYIADGKHSILFSTHITSDLEKCADFITYIKKGEIIESTDVVSFKEKYLLVSGDDAKLDDARKANVIGYHKTHVNFEGMIPASLKEEFSDFELTGPGLEDIMVHIER